MKFLETLRQAVSGHSTGRGREGVEWLHLKVVRLFEEGRFSEATEAARRLLEVQRGELGEDHPDYATALSNLGALLQRQGDLEGSEPLLRQALDIRKTALGEGHPDCATSLNNLGELLALRENHAEAEPLLRQALAIRREVLGASHPDYAISLSSLGLLLHSRGDSAGAESLLRQALAVRRDTRGESHPDYATGLSNLAHLLFARGDLAQSEALLRQALAIRKAAIGEHHPDTIATENNLTRLLQHRAEIARTEASLLRAPPARAEVETPPARAPDGASEPLSDSGAALDSGSFPAGPWPGSGDEIGSPPAARGSAECAAELALLTDMFREAGAQLREAGKRMQANGLFPDASLFRALAACHVRLSGLCAEVHGLAESLGVLGPLPEPEHGLRGIGSLLDAVAQAEAGRSCSRALSVLERVLRLRSHDPGDHPALHDCQAKARELHRIVTAGPAHDPPPVVEQLARGEHPFACLLDLVNADTSLGDDRRTALHRTVAWAFGRALATSIAQARVVLPDSPETQHPADGLASAPEGRAAEQSSS
jgi:tetratricopeptide (TPR) repeat protein